VAPGNFFRGIFGVILAAALVVLVFEARLFALAVQDRVIRLEERLRYAQILPADLQARCGELAIQSNRGAAVCVRRGVAGFGKKSSGRKTDAAEGDQAANQKLEAGLSARCSSTRDQKMLRTTPPSARTAER